MSFRRILQKIILIGLCAFMFTLAGCSMWPESGSGGFAEHRMGVTASIAQDRFNGTGKLGGLIKRGYSNRGRQEEGQYVHDIGILSYEERLEWLRARGGERCAPGDMAKAELMLNRVKRQWVGGLRADAVIDMEQLEHRLDVVDERLFKGKCQPGAQVFVAQPQAIEPALVTKGGYVPSQPTAQQLETPAPPEPIYDQRIQTAPIYAPHHYHQNPQVIQRVPTDYYRAQHHQVYVQPNPVLQK